MAFAFHGLPKKTVPAVSPEPGAGVTVHWSKTIPPIDVLAARLSAVIETPFVFGEMVEAKKYIEPDPQMKSTEPSM